MTGHQINSLVGDLVAMAQAMERLPQVEAELAKAYDTLHIGQIANDEIRADLEQARSYASTLEQKVRDAEVAKDAAETMFLEADERADKALSFLADADRALAAGRSLIVGPPKPQPETVSMPLDLHPAIFDHPAQGQSEPDPTSCSVTETASVLSTNAPSLDAGSTVESWTTPTPAEPNPQPYANCRYIDHLGWVSREDWLAGGGTNESYDFRY